MKTSSPSSATDRLFVRQPVSRGDNEDKFVQEIFFPFEFGRFYRRSYKPEFYFMIQDLLDDAGLICDREADFYIGRAGFKLAQGLGKHVRPNGARGADPQMAFLEPAQLMNGLSPLLEGLQGHMGIVTENIPHLREEYGSAHTVKQPHSEQLLEGLDLPRNGRLRKIELLCRPREAPVLRHSQKGLEVREIHICRHLGVSCAV